MKIKTSKRLLCVLLTVFLVLPTLLAGTLLTVSAASVTYTVTGASSGSISYIGKNYTTGALNQSLTFELNSGFTMQSSDGVTYYATCIYAGRADPPIGTQFSYRYGYGASSFTDGLLQGTEKGPHYVVNASSSVSPTAPNYDPMVGYGREVTADFVFSCWYWAYQYQNNYGGVTFDNNLLQEAVAIAYRYEYDTRLIKYGNTTHKWDGWEPSRGPYTYWQGTPYSQWRIDTNHFSRATSNANIVDAANDILDAAMTSPISPSTESDGTMTYTDSAGTEYEMFALSGPSRSGSSQPYQDLLLFRAKENPPSPPKYTITIYKYKEGTPHYPAYVIGSDKVLAGAEFSLYKEDGGRWVFQRSLTTVGGAFADMNQFGELEQGRYYVQETKAPPGYELDNTPQYVTLPDDAGGNSTVVLFFDNPESKPNTGAIDVLKHDSSGRPIAGVTFELWYDSSKMAYMGQRATTGPSGIVTFTGLTPGTTYWVFETAAPAGFIVDPNKGYPAKVVANRTVRVNNGNAIVNYPDTVTWTPHIYKRLTGRDLEDDEFTFVLEESTGSTWKILQTVTNREDGVVPFTWVKYEQSDVGEYKYRVRELVGDDETIDYDGHIVEFTVTVELTDNKLTAKERVSGDTTFNNTYSEPVEPTGEWTPSVTKILIGRELKDNEFTFLLKEDGRTLQTVKNLGNSVPFEAIYYTKLDVGTHTYTIEEQNDGDPTITYDGHIATYTVEVELADGELTVTASLSDDLMRLGIAFFNNTYTEPEEPTGSWTPKVTKVLTGRELKDGEFEFVLEQDGVMEIQRVKNKPDGTVPFEPIHYTSPGTYNYTVHEYSGSDKTIAYDSHRVDFTVTVELVDGKLTVTESVSGDTTFNNIYTEPVEPTGKWTPTVTKELTGRNLEDNEFTFVLKDSEGHTLQTVKNRANGSIPFTAIHYTKSDVGTHTYTVEEQNGSDPTITYDGHTVTFTVTVSYSGSGTELTVSESVSGDTTFNNIYTEPVEPTGKWTPTVTKELTGRNLEDNEFTFVLKDSEGHTLQTVKNRANGSIPFTAIHYTKSDVGTHTYTVEEQNGSDPTITYDSHKVTFTVTVSYSGSGTELTVSESVSGGTTFKNTYTEPVEPTGEWTPTVTKELTGRNLEDGEFTFVLAEDGRELQRKSNLANGTIPFDTIFYAKADIGEHTYTIYEVSGSDPTITYDGHTVTFTVTVSYSGSGTELTVSESVSGNTTFNNIYTEPEGYWTPDVFKRYNLDLSGGDFEFILEEDGVGELQRKSNLADGSIPFEAIHYTSADIGTHYYTIREVAGTNPLIDYDADPIEFTVVVSDDGSGGLTVSATRTTSVDYFYNTYTEPEGKWEPEVTKELIGRPLSYGEFTFVLEEDGTELQRVQNNADGSIPFTALHYTLENVGYHTYTIREISGSDSTVLYDEHVVTFDVTVEDSGRTLTVMWLTHGETTFTNYALTVTWTPHTSKTLVGRPLQNSEFEFVLKDSSGTVLQTKSNRADGSIVFDPLVFTLADVGTHTYTVEEKNGGDTTLLYDSHVVTFTVTISYTEGDTEMTVLESTSGETTFTNYVAVKIEIEKTDPNGNTLAGAEFLLEWSDDNGSTWHNVFYATTITKGGCSNPDIVDGTVTTGKDGKITFENLYPTLRYRLTETKAPDGMQLLAESAFDGTLPSPEGETTLSLRVVNTETLTLPATGGKGFGGVFAATVLLCGSLCILIGGVRKNKRKDDDK